MNPFHEAYAYSKQQMFNFPETLPINHQSFYQPKTWTRKRSRDEFYAQTSSNQFFCENKLPQIQLEMDALILQHTKKIRLEFQERQKQEAKVLVVRMGESMAKTLREKEDDMEKMERWNAMLEEKAKGLCAENQLWREMAQTNEAAANSLRTQLQHALAEEQLESCASCDYIYDKRVCRMCGERQCSVVVLPCRHLCLCGGCGSGSHKLRDCPVCKATMTATLHVNMS